MNTTENVMSLVDNFGYAIGVGAAKVSTVLRTEVQTAIDELVADNASLREQNTALDSACAELDKANLSFARRELWWNEKMFELEEKLKWAHHTPELLSDADAAADLAGLPRPSAEPVDAWNKAILDRGMVIAGDYIEAEQLPTLPDPSLHDGVCVDEKGKYRGTFDGFTSEQMRAYAWQSIASLEAENERLLEALREIKGKAGSAEAVYEIAKTAIATTGKQA